MNAYEVWCILLAMNFCIVLYGLCRRQLKTINKTTLASDVRSRAAMETGRPIPVLWTYGFCGVAICRS